MKTIDNIARTGLNGVLTQSTLSASCQEISVPADTRFEAQILHFQGDIHLKVILMGEGASCDIKIAYLSNKNNKNNIKVEVLHQHKNTTSSQVIKGVLTDSAQMTFDGRIRIFKDAQKCDGAQNHRAILLSDKAQVTATPELEIFADDVKCAHGSAVGPLDEEHLFYLMSRGIGANESKWLLIKAFLSDALPESFEQYIDEWMQENV